MIAGGADRLRTSAIFSTAPLVDLPAHLVVMRFGDKTMDKMMWFVDGKEVTPEEMRAMADAVENPQYDHDKLDGCRAELTCAGHVVRASKYGRLIFFEAPYHA